MLLTRRFAERLLARRAPGAPHASRGALLGRIVNLLDRRVAHHEAGCVPYLVSKKALAEFTCSAAIELAPEFAVNGVAPGAVLPPPGKGDDTLWDAAGPVPLNARCRPEDVAEAVAWLLESDVVTGQIVYVDGGQHLL
jgi:NAD(P)-dependent dehydrogenase (short-subunit alcohol dehydrogenase family)